MGIKNVSNDIYVLSFLPGVARGRVLDKVLRRVTRMLTRGGVSNTATRRGATPSCARYCILYGVGSSTL